MKKMLAKKVAIKTAANSFHHILFWKSRLLVHLKQNRNENNDYVYMYINNVISSNNQS